MPGSLPQGRGAQAPAARQGSGGVGLSRTPAKPAPQRWGGRRTGDSGWKVDHSTWLSQTGALVTRKQERQGGAVPGSSSGTTIRPF